MTVFIGRRASSTAFGGPPPPQAGEDQERSRHSVILPRATGEGDHAQHGGGGARPVALGDFA